VNRPFGAIKLLEMGAGMTEFRKNIVNDETMRR
jgi:hypothetical protein